MQKRENPSDQTACQKMDVKYAASLLHNTAAKRNSIAHYCMCILLEINSVNKPISKVTSKYELRLRLIGVFVSALKRNSDGEGKQGKDKGIQRNQVQQRPSDGCPELRRTD
jgi:hypothetical protein